jgi:hypothetical protein
MPAERKISCATWAPVIRRLVGTFENLLKVLVTFHCANMTNAIAGSMKTKYIGSNIIALLTF